MFHQTKLRLNLFVNALMHANVEDFVVVAAVVIVVYDAVSITAAISLVSLNLTPNWYRDVQLELLQHSIELHPDQLKSVR